MTVYPLSGFASIFFAMCIASLSLLSRCRTDEKCAPPFASFRTAIFSDPLVRAFLGLFGRSLNLNHGDTAKLIRDRQGDGAYISSISAVCLEAWDAFGAQVLSLDGLLNDACYRATSAIESLSSSFRAVTDATKSVNDKLAAVDASLDERRGDVVTLKGAVAEVCSFYSTDDANGPTGSALREAFSNAGFILRGEADSDDGDSERTGSGGMGRRTMVVSAVLACEGVTFLLFGMAAACGYERLTKVLWFFSACAALIGIPTIVLALVNERTAKCSSTREVCEKKLSEAINNINESGRALVDEAMKAAKKASRSRENMLRYITMMMKPGVSGSFVRLGFVARRIASFKDDYEKIVGTSRGKDKLYDGLNNVTLALNNLENTLSMLNPSEVIRAYDSAVIAESVLEKVKPILETRINEAVGSLSEQRDAGRCESVAKVECSVSSARQLIFFISASFSALFLFVLVFLRA